MVNRKKIKYCGLFGGSFDPPHAGHVAVSSICAQLLSLDEIWWIVAPKVPGKPKPFFSRSQRIEMVNQLLQNENEARARIVQVDNEARARIVQVDIDAVHTIDLVRHVQQKYPDYRFCLIMGTDNFINLHTWKDWISLFQSIPVVALSRPGSESKVKDSIVAQTFPGKTYKCRTDNDSTLIILFLASDVYTIDLVCHVQQKYPDYSFCLIMGTDNKVKDSIVVQTFPGKTYKCRTDNESELDREEIFEQLFHSPLPTWVFLDGLRLDVSSSQWKALQQ